MSSSSDSSLPSPYGYNEGYDFSEEEEEVSDGLAHSNGRVYDDMDSLESSSKSQKFPGLFPLKELCCRFVGQSLPFGVVQLYPSRVPEEVQRRIAFWSFPANEWKLRDYARVMGGVTREDFQHARRSEVKGMVQSGMYLTGTVLDHYSSFSGGSERVNFRAYVQFDRGCITTTKCSCGEQNWCRHVLALCLARLDESAPLQLHPPISETLTNLDRDQLQKLVQYFLEKLPLEGVAAVQEIASSLLDNGSEISRTAGAPDLTAGGSLGDKPIWQMDKNVIIRRLDSAYVMKLDEKYPGYYESSALQKCTSTLVGFKEFTADSGPFTHSDLYALMKYEDDNLSIALMWAIEKLSTEISEEALQHAYPKLDTMTKDQKWVEWCFCRMLLPVMQIFFASPAISSSAKEDVTECLAQCLQQDLPSPIVELLNCFNHIATNRVSADAISCKQLLTHLQQALTNNSRHESNTGGLQVSDPALLHCAIAFVQYMDFYNRLSAPDMEDILVSICSLIFPTILTEAATLEELVAIRVDHDLQGISLPLLLEYGTTLLHCISSPDLAAELVFKLMGNQLLVTNCSKEALVYYNWAAKALIAKVESAAIFTRACDEVKLKLNDLCIRGLQQTNLALESYPDPTAVLTWMWNVMRLLCRCETGNCLKVVGQMTQELIGMLSSTIPISCSTPGADSTDSENTNLPLDIMTDSFTGLLFDLFMMLPASDGQELFCVLCKAYPTPVDAKRSLEMGHFRYDDWRQSLLNGASAFSRTQNTTFFPSKPPMEGFENQLEEANRRCGYNVRYRQASTNSTLQDDIERDEILQLCRTQCSVSISHISFLEQLHKRLQVARAPFQFQLHLLTAQVSNCRRHDWARNAPDYGYNKQGVLSSSDVYRYRQAYGDGSVKECVLACDDIGSSLQALDDMWKFSMIPESALTFIEAVQDLASPQFSDVMCDILISVLDCKASLHMRIFELIHKISLKPQHILQAVNIVSCSTSGKAQSSEERRTAFIQCAENIGKVYNQHKDSGDEEMLIELKVKALDLLRQARSNAVSRVTLDFSMYQTHSEHPRVDLSSVMHVVCDSGQDALADLLALMEMRPRDCLLQSLKEMTELCNCYFKDSGPPKPLQAPPFKETVEALLEKRKTKIKTVLVAHGESEQKELTKDLKASFQFLGDEAAFTTFEQELATILQNPDRSGYGPHFRWPWERGV